MRRLMSGVIAATALLATASRAGAQALGPQRQFLAIEPYYEHTRLDNDAGAPRTSLNGYGGRLWINLEPFHFIPYSSIALFTSYAPTQQSSNITALHYGAEYDQYLVRRPLGGVIDPFLAIGGGLYRVTTDVGTARFRQTRWAVTPGGGIRVPIPNRLELRGDVKDLIRFNTKTAPGGTGRTTHKLLLQGAVGLTF
jgi:hypothetical protein